jgi:hypothetical protein
MVAKLAGAAARLDELAEVAELMGDDEGAGRLRVEGSRCREQAMALLDADPPTA